MNGGRLSTSNIKFIKKIATWGKGKRSRRRVAIAGIVLTILFCYFMKWMKNRIYSFTHCLDGWLFKGVMVFSCVLLLVAAGLFAPRFQAASPAHKKETERIVQTVWQTSESVTDLSEATDILRTNLKLLKKQNRDCVAWLYIADTGISYPIMQNKGDENYYLDRDVNQDRDRRGALILDNDSNLNMEQTNLIVHGHHMESGEMFGNLMKYEDETFGNRHKIIELITEDEIRSYELFGVFYSKVYYQDEDVFKYYEYSDLSDESDYNKFCENIANMSLYKTDVTTGYGDEFITLSTCSYHTENGRFVVVGKRFY